MPFFQTMKDLYARLKDVGFDANFVRYRILPEWWEDKLAWTDSNRAMAEAAISRMLGFPISQLRNPSTKLKLPPISSVRLKRNKGVDVRDVLPSILLAEQTIKNIIKVLKPIPSFCGQLSADDVRKIILSKHRSVEYAWKSPGFAGGLA